jgi:hypothetical protein
MLDLLGVLFSTMAVLFVVWRAAKLDDVYPWFEHTPGPEGDAKLRNDRGRPADGLGGHRPSR